MIRMIERWEAGHVARNGEHFELSLSVGENGAPVALVGPPRDGIVPVDVLVDWNSSNTAVMEKVGRELSFYLLELNEPDPWAYAQYHCGTTSNGYSDVQWSYFQGSQELLKADQPVMPASSELAQAKSGLKEGPVMIPRFYERDIDILLAEEFKVSPAFANWFLLAIDCAACRTGKVVEVAVSKSDNLGESDLVVLFESFDSKTRFAFFIEDKIDAPLQPEQLARYRKRAEIGRQRGLYSHFHVILCSPKAYPETHRDSSGFDAYVSYESIAAFIRENDPANGRNMYRADIIASAALKTGHAVWTKDTDEQTNTFWQAAYEIAIKDFSELEMKPPNYASGQTWIGFRPYEMPTLPRRVAIDLKADRGFADLTFSGILCRLFAPLISSILEIDMTVHQAGKSTVVRLKIPIFGISAFDAAAEENVRAAFTASARLIRFYRQHRLVLDAAASKSLPEPLAPEFSHSATVVSRLEEL